MPGKAGTTEDRPGFQKQRVAVRIEPRKAIRTVDFGEIG